jgi:CheY-like chemotaxis protein
MAQDVTRGGAPLLIAFFGEAARRMPAIQRITRELDADAGIDGALGLLAELRVEAHTIVGGAAVVGLSGVLAAAKALESAVADAADGDASFGTAEAAEARRLADRLADEIGRIRPSAAAAGPAGSSEAQRGSPPTTRTILSAEDDATNRALITTVVAYRPHVRLINVVDGHDVPGWTRSESLDLMLLDLNLPGAGGEEILNGVRSDPELESLPVLILSGDAAPPTRTRLLAAGATAFLTKPVSVVELLGYIDEYCVEADT